MSIKQKTILVGKGLERLKFGMNFDEVKSILGKADEVERFSYTDSDEDLAESWHYDELGLSLSFDEAQDWRLVNMAISTNDYELNGVKLIDLDLEQVIDILEGWDLGEMEYEDLSSKEEGKAKLISIDKSSMNFWFEENELSEIQWGPIYKKDQVIWPD